MPGMYPPDSLWVKLAEYLARRFPKNRFLQWLVTDS